MVKADEIIKQQKIRENRKNITFNKIYCHIEKKIYLASSTNNYFIWYQIPEFLVGSPTYKFCECKEYIQKKLKIDGFKTIIYEPNILLVNWEK
jgi:hypothetical protein